MTKTCPNLSGGYFGWFERGMATLIVQYGKLFEFSRGKSVFNIKLLRKLFKLLTKIWLCIEGMQGSNDIVYSHMYDVCEAGWSNVPATVHKISKIHRKKPTYNFIEKRDSGTGVSREFF